MEMGDLVRTGLDKLEESISGGPTMEISDLMKIGLGTLAKCISGGPIEVVGNKGINMGSNISWIFVMVESMR